ncbi:hypothetical protein [Herbaspirillum huttiense]|uniref:hypothetical protein n=1 Tax=Herbaspirillum huttiense TaxID=863372 RepID=UPI0012FE8CDC|nr:hypothetical protein [Herbaspirillum huttiense]MBN9359030.1 hypothetical protein [Herbaspirillum huttiense]
MVRHAGTVQQPLHVEPVHGFATQARFDGQHHGQGVGLGVQCQPGFDQCGHAGGVPAADQVRTLPRPLFVLDGGADLRHQAAWHVWPGRVRKHQPEQAGRRLQCRPLRREALRELGQGVAR